MCSYYLNLVPRGSTSIIFRESTTCTSYMQFQAVYCLGNMAWMYMLYDRSWYINVREDVTAVSFPTTMLVKEYFDDRHDHHYFTWNNYPPEFSNPVCTG